MNAPVEQWGRRLSDTLRAALAEADFARARELATHGDGQARSLATEYAFMVRGLGITVRVLMDLVAPSLGRIAAAAVPAARADAAAIVERFAQDIARIAGAPQPAAGAGLEAAIRAADAALTACQAWFEREQGRLADEIVAAVDAADRRRALALVDAKEQGQYLPLHDRLVRFMAECFGWALRHGGADELLQYQLGAAEGQRRGFDKWETMPTADFAWTTTFLLKQHMGQVAVTEDRDKFTIVQTPCGSGGRLRLMGAYEGPQALPFVEAPGALTFGEPRVPVYCSHCPIWNASATLRWFGRAHWVFDHPARADGSCTLHIYKRREDTPPAFLRTVDLDAPGA